jgi:hypothetical protein
MTAPGPGHTRPQRNAPGPQRNAPGHVGWERPGPGAPTFWDAAQIRQVSHQVADLVADYLTGLPDGPAYQGCR